VLLRGNFILLFAAQIGFHILQAKQDNKPHRNGKKSVRGKIAFIPK
jgi:hypothetical protein